MTNSSRVKHPLPLERRKSQASEDGEMRSYMGCMLPLIYSTEKLKRLSQRDMQLANPFVRIIPTLPLDRHMLCLATSAPSTLDQYCAAAFFVHQNPAFRRFELEYAPRQHHGELLSRITEFDATLKEARRKNEEWLKANCPDHVSNLETIARNQNIVDRFGSDRHSTRIRQSEAAKKAIERIENAIQLRCMKLGLQLPHPVLLQYDQVDRPSLDTLSFRLNEMRTKLRFANDHLWSDGELIHSLLLAYLNDECKIHVPKTNALRPFVRAIRGSGNRGAMYDMRNVENKPTDEFGWPADASMDPLIIDFPDVRCAYEHPTVIHQDKKRAVIGYFEQAKTPVGLGNGFFGIQRGDRAELIVIDWKTAFGLFASAEYYASQGILDAILSAATP